MDAEKLKEIVEAHGKWRCGERGGAHADLTGANLTGANLTDADLAGANLAGANLTDADLAGANLTGADLTDADLAGANLAGAYLTGANLTGANLTGADLTDADLTDADLTGAYLTGADLTDADLTGAYLTGARNVPADLATHKDPETPYVRGATIDYAARAAAYRERHPDAPVVERLDARILEAITIGGGKLNMGTWHQCQTTHCRAGWAITLAGEKGAELEREHGPERAGRMIYRASTGRVPHFYATDEQALEDIRRCAAEQAA